MNIRRQIQTWLVLGFLLGGRCGLRAAEPPVDLSRQIRPILAGNCLKCHGPDAGERRPRPRLVGGVARAAGSRAAEPAGPASRDRLVWLVVTVATPDAERTRYTTALWEVDPAGARPARRLTRSVKGESAAAFTPSQM